MDPDSGRLNLGMYRGMIGQKNTLPVLIWRAQNWGSDFQKWTDRGQEMPVACVYGWEPSWSSAPPRRFRRTSPSTTSSAPCAASRWNW